MAMKSMLISFGHAASHSRWLVHEPNQRSISSTMPTVRRSRSGWPWGSRFRCASLAAVKSWPAPFGQAAAHAPQARDWGAGGDARAAGDALGGVHRAVGARLGARDQVRVRRRAGGRGDEAAGLDDP